MKICLLSYRGNMFCGGQGVYLYHLARTLVEAGHQVHVLCGPPYPDDIPGAVLHRIENHNFINKPGDWLPHEEPLSVFRPLNFMEFALSRIGPNPEMLAFSIRCFQALKRLHREIGFDVVHDNQGLGYGLLLIRGLGLPVVATIHHPLAVDRVEDIKQMAGMWQKAKRALYYPLLMQGIVARSVDQVITVSGVAGRKVAEEYRLDPGMVHVVHNGVDLELFRPIPEVRKIPGRMIFVGSSEDRKKGIFYLLHAMTLLDDPRISLTIVDGRLRPERVYARNLLRSLGLDERVAIKEKIDNEALVREYNRAEVAVVPSLFEGFGLPAAEAMACGVPVIASDAGALPEVTGEDGAAACLVPREDSEALAAAIKNLFSSPALREAMGKAGRARAEKYFSWSSAGRQMFRIYQQAQDKRR